MIGYLYKDWILYRKQIICFSLAAVLLSIPVLIEPDEEMVTKELIQVLLCVMCGLIFLIIGMFQQGIFEYDEYDKWKMYVVALPKTQSAMIIEKYIFTFIISLSAFVWCKILNILVNNVHNMNCNIIWFVLLMAGVQLIFRAIEIPLIFGFGSKCGGQYRMAVSFIVISVVFIYLLFGDISIFGSEEKLIKAFVELLSGNMKEKLRHAAEIVFGVSIALNVISYKISTLVYKRSLS